MQVVANIPASLVLQVISSLKTILRVLHANPARGEHTNLPRMHLHARSVSLENTKTRQAKKRHVIVALQVPTRTILGQ